MRSLFSFCFILLFFQFSSGQKIFSQLGPDSDYDFWNKDMFFTFQTGIWQPVGKLNKSFNLTPNQGFRWGLHVNNRIIFQLGASFN
jgi:hypothetical protein